MVAVWQSEQAQRCPDCGTFEWEWEEDASAWEADIHLCLGCHSLEKVRDETHRTAKDPAGYKMRLYKG